MLYEIDTAFCSRCQRYVKIFDAENDEFSTKEIICSECGAILVAVRSENQTKIDSDILINSLDKYIRRENIKTDKKTKVRQYSSRYSAV